MELTDPLDGVEYDERHVARLNEELKGVELVEGSDRWCVFKVDFDAEHRKPVCFYFDAKLGDKGTIDDCEYSAVDEVQEWIANHRRRLKAKAAREASGLPKRDRACAEEGLDYTAMMNSGDGVPQRGSSTRLLSFWVRVDRVFHTDDDEKPFEQPMDQPDQPSRKKKARRKGATLCGNQPVS